LGLISQVITAGTPKKSKPVPSCNVTVEDDDQLGLAEALEKRAVELKLAAYAIVEAEQAQLLGQSRPPRAAPGPKPAQRGRRTKSGKRQSAASARGSVCRDAQAPPDAAKPAGPGADIAGGGPCGSVCRDAQPPPDGAKQAGPGGDVAGGYPCSSVCCDAQPPPEGAQAAGPGGDATKAADAHGPDSGIAEPAGGVCATVPLSAGSNGLVSQACPLNGPAGDALPPDPRVGGAAGADALAPDVPSGHATPTYAVEGLALPDPAIHTAPLRGARTDSPCPEGPRRGLCEEPDAIPGGVLPADVLPEAGASAERVFRWGEVVWCRVKGWPSWPALVVTGQDAKLIKSVRGMAFV
jgi:hypothetical protein